MTAKEFFSQDFTKMTFQQVLDQIQQEMPEATNEDKMLILDNVVKIEKKQREEKQAK